MIQIRYVDATYTKFINISSTVISTIFNQSNEGALQKYENN